MTQAAWSRMLLASAAVALMIVIAGCTSPDSDREATPSSAATPSPTSAPPSSAPTTTNARAAAEAAVMAAYRAFWADVVAVGKTADWRSPRLAAHATGQALAEARATFRTLSARGLVARGTVDLRPTVISVKGARATLYDCNSTSNFLAYDAKTGALRDRSSGRRNGKTVTLVRQGGVWKLATTVTEVGRCRR